MTTQWENIHNILYFEEYLFIIYDGGGKGLKFNNVYNRD